MNALWAALPINPSNAIGGQSERATRIITIQLLTNQSNYRLSEKGDAYTNREGYNLNLIVEIRIVQMSLRPPFRCGSGAFVLVDVGK